VNQQGSYLELCIVRHSMLKKIAFNQFQHTHAGVKTNYMTEQHVQQIKPCYNLLRVYSLVGEILIFKIFF